MEGTDQLVPKVEPPRGMYPARLDDKGRVKLPTPFQEYLKAQPEAKLFVTSLDRRIGQIYPIHVWRENENFFQNYKEDPQTAQNVWFTAQDLGADAEMDSQGRVLFSPELRRALGIENQPVRLYAYRGRIQVLSEPIYEERKKESEQTPSANVNKLEAAGLK